jgi:hypothetical protein
MRAIMSLNSTWSAVSGGPRDWQLRLAQKCDFFDTQYGIDPYFHVYFFSLHLPFGPVEGLLGVSPLRCY